MHGFHFCTKVNLSILKLLELLGAGLGDTANSSFLKHMQQGGLSQD